MESQVKFCSTQNISRASQQNSDAAFSKTAEVVEDLFEIRHSKKKAPYSSRSIQQPPNWFETTMLKVEIVSVATKLKTFTPNMSAQIILDYTWQTSFIQLKLNLTFQYDGCEFIMAEPTNLL